MVFNERRYLSSCSYVFSPVITRLEKRELVYYASRVFVCLSDMRYLCVFFSSSWCRGLVAACDCGTPLTVHLNLR